MGKKKKEKVVYVDDGSTIADMSHVSGPRLGRRHPAAPHPKAKDVWNTYWNAVKMMFTPMLVIPNFYSWSLFFTACVVLIRWEIVYAAHPERFWSGSNQILQCANCKDKTCQIKRNVKTAAKKKKKKK